MFNKKSTQKSFITVGILVVSLFVVSAFAAPTPPPTYYITSDYTMQSDMYARFVINADDITFNFNGYTISGNGLGTGIYINGKEDIDFTGNGRIENHKVGIKVVGGDGIHTGTGSKYVDDCDTGISLYNSDWVTLRSFDITECEYGVFMKYCNNCANLICEIDGSGLIRDTETGMQLQENDNNEYTTVEIYDCQSDGIDADDEDYCSYEDIYSYYNDVYGLDFQNADFTDFYDHIGYNYATDNGVTGLYIRNNTYYSEDGVYEYIQLNENGLYGLHIKNNSVDNAFWDCYGEDNGYYDRRDENGQGYNDYYYCDFGTTIWY